MYRQAVSEDLNSSLLDSARRGFFGVLRRKRMSPQFIEKEGEDLFAQACFEYSRRRAEGIEIRDPVAWIVVCGWHRAVGLLETRDWRPQLVSTERIGELPGDSTPAPEEDVLNEDRYRKVREAVERLPTYQRQLLALSYFEGKSIREAARELGWTPSKAQRAHETARRRLKTVLGVESSDQLTIGVGLFAYLTFEHEGGCSPKLRLLGTAEGAVDAVVQHASHFGDRALELLRRPFAHDGTSEGQPAGDPLAEVNELGHRIAAEGQHGPVALLARAGRRVSEAGKRLMASGAVETSAAAADGGSRVVEVCKALAAACLIGGAATGALVVSEDHGRAHRQPQPRPAASIRTRSQPQSAQRAERTPSRAASASGQMQESTRTVGPQPEAAAPSAREQIAQPSPAARQAHHRQEQEANVEEQFSPTGQIAAESEAPSGGPTSGAFSSAESTPSGSSTEGDASTPAPSAREKTEEAQTEKQFRGGLP